MVEKYGANITLSLNLIVINCWYGNVVETVFFFILIIFFMFLYCFIVLILKNKKNINLMYF
jgi:hypothetical protein